MDSSDFLDDYIEVRGEEAIGDKIQGIEIFYSSLAGCNNLYKCQIFGRNHILKTLRHQYKGTDFYETALFKEFSIGFQLEHPNICRTLGWRQLPNMGNCILMEFIDGITLKEFIQQGRLTEKLAYKFINEICAAMEYIHSKQIVHRDIKPGNIIITHNGLHVKLIDFSLSDCDDFTVLKVPAGTARYIAPEAMVNGNPLDLRADIYSIGVLIGELAVIIKDRHLAGVSKRCMHKNKEKRIQSIADLRVEVNSGKGKFVKRSIAFAACAVVLGVAAFFLYPNGNESVQKQPLYTGNIAYSQECRMILANEKVKLAANKDKKVDPSDSIRVMDKLMEALNKEYPLQEQRNTTAYRRAWHSLYMEVKEMYK